VFDCANRCGKTGQRFLPAASHVKMMAAVQPFLSGAISKTVNLPNDATVDEVAEVYEEGWRLGLKAVALYRDGCKASQPLSTTSKEKDDDKPTGDAAKAAKAGESAKADAWGRKVTPDLEAKLSETIVPGLSPIPLTNAPQDTTQLMLGLTPVTGPSGSRPKGLRVRLPKKRVGFTQEARVGGHKIFLRTGQYEDGTLGEIFIDMHKEGAAFRSLMNCFAMSVSIGLQYGVPLQTYVDQFTFTRFEPQGVVEGHPYVKFSTSIVDYLFRVLGCEYLGRYDLAHVKPEETEAAASQHVGMMGGGRKEDRVSESEIPVSLAYTPEALARSASDAETLEQKALRAPHDAAHDHAAQASPLDAQLDAMMGDAPVCDVCGHITVRNGACYKCLNCGNSMGCS
jgi:ribonucleoside-diphosphate reductase alpha chain